MSNADEIAARRLLKAIATGAILLLLVITFFSLLRSIDTGKVGVVTQYGQVTGRELDEGLNFVAPWGINRVTEYDTKTQKVTAEAKAATKDLQDVTATVVMNYGVNRGKVSEVHQRVGKEYQSIEIDPQVQEAFKAVSARYTASELITNRAEVKNAVLENLRERVQKDNRYTVHDIAITNFTFSAEFNAAIEAVQVANQQVAKARQELETTKVQAEKDIAAARGAAEAQRLQQQTITPELLELRKIESQNHAINKWNGVLPTTQAGDGSNFLFQR